MNRLSIAVMATIAAFLSAAAFIHASPAAPEDCSGVVEARWLDDGRKMQLTIDYSYTDPEGLSWRAPKDSVVDGASIPRLAWSAIGGPFEGKYRKASVVHDVACDKKDRRWQAVHSMFYKAMICGGVDEVKAKVMYQAVYHCGPRWGPASLRLIPCSGEGFTSYLSALYDYVTASPKVSIETLHSLDTKALTSVSMEPRGKAMLQPFILREPALNNMDFQIKPKRGGI
jgi:hypothetical protein